MREHSFIHPDNAKLYKLAWLAPMAQEVSTMLEVDTLEVVADAGYFSQGQIKQCLGY